MEFIPVNPARTPAGSFAVFAEHPVLRNAAPIPLPPNTSLNNFEISGSTLSSEIAANLGFGPFFKSSAGQKAQAFFYEICLYSNQLAPDPNSGAAIVGTRWGSGLRVIVKVTSRTLDGELSIGAIAAAVHLRQANASYHISAHGLPVAALGAIAGTLPTLGEFNLDAYKNIGLITDKLQTYLVANAAALVPEPYQIALARPLTGDRLTEARSIVFGIRNVARGRNHEETTAGAGPDIDTATLAATLESFSDPPTDADRSAANQWLKDLRGLL